jgi:hypothetical protein
MNFKKLIVAVSLATALSTTALSAAAATSTLTFSSNGVASFSNLSTGSSFDDIFSFTLTSSNDATVSAISGFLLSGITGTDTVSFSSIKLLSGETTIATGTLSSLFSANGIAVVGSSGLAAGEYSIEIAGTAINGESGNYSGNVNLVSAVPEPESYAMLLAGLGLMGTIARRRSKARAV